MNYLRHNSISTHRLFGGGESNPSTSTASTTVNQQATTQSGIAATGGSTVTVSTLDLPLAEHAIDAVATIAQYNTGSANETTAFLAQQLGQIVANTVPQTPAAQAEIIGGTPPTNLVTPSQTAAAASAPKWTTIDYVLAASAVLSIAAYFRKGKTA